MRAWHAAAAWLATGCGGGEVPFESRSPVVAIDPIARLAVTGVAWEIDPIERGVDGIVVLEHLEDFPFPEGLLRSLSVPGFEESWATPSGPVGFHVVATPDLDGDGRGDLATAIYDEDGTETVVARGGRSGERLWEHAAAPWTGIHVTPIDDIDEDRVADLGVAAYEPDDEERGLVGVLSGASGAAVWTVDGEPREYLGAENLVSVADRDGDGRRDLATQRFDGPFARVQVVSSTSGERIDEVSLPEQDVWLCREAGDLDADGVPEILLSTIAPGEITLSAWSFPSGALWSLPGFACSAFGTFDLDADGQGDVLAGEGLDTPGRAIVAVSGRTGEEIARLAMPEDRPGAMLGADIVDLPDEGGWAMVDRTREGGVWIWEARRTSR